MTLSIIHIIIKIVRGSGSEDDDNNIHTCMFTERFERFESFHKHAEHDRAGERSPKKHYSESFGLSTIQVSMHKDTPRTERILRMRGDLKKGV